MKKLFTIVFSAALMGICSLAQAQDPSSKNLNGQPVMEQVEATQSDDAKTREAERPQSTDEQLQNDADAMKENFEGATIDKVGPNGEELFMERGKYFYINEEGRKVKVKKSEARDKSKDGIQ